MKAKTEWVLGYINTGGTLRVGWIETPVMPRQTSPWEKPKTLEPAAKEPA